MKSLWIIINLKFSVWKKTVYHRTTAPYFYSASQSRYLCRYVSGRGGVLSLRPADFLGGLLFRNWSFFFCFNAGGRRACFLQSRYYLAILFCHLYHYNLCEAQGLCDHLVGEILRRSQLSVSQMENFSGMFI